MMRSSNTKQSSSRREQSQSRPSRRPLFAIFRFLPRMPSVFNILRFSVYSAVLVWTVICLAIAAHFQSILESSDLTRFVPFAIFVCSASLLIVIALLGFSLWKERNPISTRVELGCLGLAGVLWLALSGFVASSDAEDADVECFSSSDSSEVINVPSFNTEIYQAQYRVLEAFSFFNVILILGFFFFLLALALRQHRLGERQVWVSSVTAFPWFGKSGKQDGGKLPAPVTHRSRSRSRPDMSEKRKDSQRTQDSGRTQTAKRPEPTRRESWHLVDLVRPLAYRDDSRRTQPHRQNSSRSQVHRHDSSRSQVNRQDSQRAQPHRQDSQRAQVHRQDTQRSRGRLPQPVDAPTRNESPTYVYWLPHKTPDQAHVRDTRPRDKYHRDASPRR